MRQSFCVLGLIATALTGIAAIRDTTDWANGRYPANRGHAILIEKRPTAPP